MVLSELRIFVFYEYRPHEGFLFVSDGQNVRKSIFGGVHGARRDSFGIFSELR